VNQFRLLRSRRFAPLFVVQFLGAFNDNVFRFALIIFLTFNMAEDIGIDPRSLVVISGGVFILPFFLFSSIAGQLADKCEKSLLIRRIKFIEILIVALAALAFWCENTIFLFCVLFLMGTQSAFFGPLKYAILPQLLDEFELTGSNGLIQLGTYAAILLGAASGGILAAVAGVGPAAVVGCLIVLALLGWLCAHAIPLAPGADDTVIVEWNLPLATFRLLRYAADNHVVLVLVLTISWFWFLGATFLSMVPSYAKQLLNADEQAVTLMNVAFTLGIGIGSVLCERYSRGRIELGLVLIAGMGMSLFAADFFFVGTPRAAPVMLTLTTLLGYAPALRAFIDLVFIGAFGALFIVPLYAALQARVESTHCARVMAALNVTNALFMVLSAVLTVTLFHYSFTITDIFGIVAMLNLLALAIVTLALPEFAQRTLALLLRRSN
jgi:MFS family permease